MRDIILATSPLLGVVLGVVLTSWLTGSRQRTTRRHGFINMQVDDLYAPLVSLRKDIRAKSELRLRISQAADASWRELCDGRSPEQLLELERERFPAFERIIKYDNQQLSEELLPDYRKMRDVLKTKFWLAEPTTRVHYQSLVDYVELWDRSMADAIPWEVMKALGHSENTLNDFYEDIDHQLTRLRAKLAKGEA